MAAYHLLNIIENQREHYGRPPSEPRHPDLASGKPWPMRDLPPLWSDQRQALGLMA